MNNPIGFGIIGCGAISRRHATAISEIENAKLVGVYDIDPHKCADAARKYGVHQYEDVNALLRDLRIDIVNIATPSGLHAELGILAAEAGKHVITEKPIDVSLEAATALIDACAEARVKLAVISQHRFDDGFQELRHIIDAGKLGRPLVGTASTKWYRSQSYYDSAAWRGTRSLDGGGSLMNQGVHSVDLLLWLMGPASTVSGKAVTLAHEIEVEDDATALITFSSGAVGTIHASTVMYPGLTERLEICGDRGMVAIEDGRIILRATMDDGHALSGHAHKPEPQGTASTSASSDPMAVNHEPHRRQIADMIEAIEQDRAPLSSGAEGRQALEFILAVYESSKADSQPVRIGEMSA